MLVTFSLIEPRAPLLEAVCADLGDSYARSGIEIAVLTFGLTSPESTEAEQVDDRQRNHRSSR